MAKQGLSTLQSRGHGWNESIFQWKLANLAYRIAPEATIIRAAVYDRSDQLAESLRQSTRAPCSAADHALEHIWTSDLQRSKK